jgi:hypothetical protein
MRYFIVYFSDLLHQAKKLTGNALSISNFSPPMRLISLLMRK